MVKLSGVLLIFGGLTLATGFLRLFSIIFLLIFLVIASFTIHQFWNENTNEKKLLEAMQFLKTLPYLLN